MKILYLTNNSADKKEEILDFLFLHHNDIQIYTRKINLEFIISNKVDFILSDRYGHVIPEDVITYLKDHVINSHPSYLPLNKGWQPNFFSIFNNNQCGATIHYVDSGIDTGSIILQKKLTFSDNDTLRTSHYISRRTIVQLLVSNWLSILNDLLQPVHQNNPGNYNSKKDFERLFSTLPNGWDSKISEIKNISPFYYQNLN